MLVLRIGGRLSEFCTYTGRNSEQIPNYGERHRCGEPISTATAEATVNQVISRRMVKKQQMRWSPRGAHLLLQVRTRVLNDDLAADFARWYPGFAGADQRQLVGAARPPTVSPGLLTGPTPRRPGQDPSRLAAEPGIAWTGRSSGGGRWR